MGSAEAGRGVLRDCPNIELALIDLILPTIDGLAALALYAVEFPHIPRNGVAPASRRIRQRKCWSYWPRVKPCRNWCWPTIAWIRGSNGADAVALLRERFGAGLPALLITGDSGPERMREAKNSGLHMLHKPVRPAQLRSLCNYLLTRR